MLSARDALYLALAAGWLLLVFFFALVLVKLGKVLGETTRLVGGITDRTVPLLGEVTTSVVQVNGQLERVDAITSSVQTITSNVAALSGLFAATLGGPVVKIAAFSYGVRRAASRRQRADMERQIKEAVKAERRAGRGRRGR